MAVQVCNNVVASSEGRELAQHGSPMFPIACYAEDMTADSVAWHWHEEFEYILSEKGILCVDVNKTRVRLNQGEGIFVNSGALHAVEQSPALLHSCVFHPRLVGGMDTIFWQKLIKPMTQPGAPAFFLLNEAVPWQKEVLACLRDAWREVADEPFDYENRARYHLSAALRILSTQCVGGKTKVSQQGADRGRADEADAPLCGGALCGGADRGEDRRLCGSERECLPALVPAAAGNHPHPVCQAVPGGKRPPNSSVPPASRPGRSGLSAVLRMAATLLKHSAR